MARNKPGFALRSTKGKFYNPMKDASISFAPAGIVDYEGNYGTSSGSAHFVKDSSPSHSSETFDSGLDITPSMGISAITSMAPILNAAFAPNIYRSSGEYSAAKLSETITVSRERYEVDDLEEVAKIYEGHGYAVSEELYTNPLLLHNRTLYDVIQCDDMLISGVSSQEIIDDILGRFGNGMRLWHTNNDGSLVADTYFVALGRLYFKDNTEV